MIINHAQQELATTVEQLINLRQQVESAKPGEDTSELAEKIRRLANYEESLRNSGVSLPENVVPEDDGKQVAAAPPKKPKAPKTPKAPS